MVSGKKNYRFVIKASKQGYKSRMGNLFFYNIFNKAVQLRVYFEVLWNEMPKQHADFSSMFSQVLSLLICFQSFSMINRGIFTMLFLSISDVYSFYVAI